MAITNRRHIRKILDDLEAINRHDVFKYTKGHLSVARSKEAVKQRAIGDQAIPKVKSDNKHLPETPDVFFTVRLDKSLKTEHKHADDFPNKNTLMPNEAVGDARKSFVDGAHDFGGITKAEQLHNFTAKSQNALKERSEKAKQYLQKIESKLHKNISRISSMEGSDMERAIQKFEFGRDSFGDLINQSSIFGPLLQTIKDELDGYVIELISTDDHHAEAIQAALSNVSNNKDLKYLKQLEDDVINLQKQSELVSAKNSRLAIAVKQKQAELDSIVPPVLDPFAVKCEPPVKLSQAERIHELRKKISAKEEYFRDVMISNLRANYVPKGQYKASFGTCRDIQAEVNSLSAGCRMLDRKVKEYDAELESLVSTLEMSEKDARILEEVIGTNDTAEIGDDPFEVIGKIEIGEVKLIDFESLEKKIDAEPWRSYIS